MSARGALVALSLAISACSGASGGSKNEDMIPPPPPAPGPSDAPGNGRERLSAADLLDPAAAPTGLIENRFYVALGSSSPALHTLKGHLRVPAGPMLGTTPDTNYGETGLLLFPGFDADFITVGDALVPVARDILGRAAPASHWRVILSPGRVWSESVDGGWSRASFPFVLVSDDTNEAHNGLATFVFDGARVSELQFQIVQETASWNRNDFWGRLPLAYTPGDIEDEAAVRDDFAHEQAERVPVRPWSDLNTSSDTMLWQQFNRGLLSDDVSTAGVVKDGVIYQGACMTRLGKYPYCTQMRHGAFSLTKSMGAALTLLRLAQKYGNGVMDARIRDFVDLGASHNGWDQVRFIDVLNMATGVGDADPNPNALDPMADENATTLGAWSSVDTEGAKLEAVAQQGDYSWGPGVVFRYNTTQTFVLAVAMDQYLKSREGASAQLWDMMEREVFTPIGIRHAPMMHTHEPGNAPGVPLMGIGMYPTADDVAKIAMLLQNGGMHQGVQLLSSSGVADALFKTGQGLRTGERNSAGFFLYNMSFWSLPHRTTGRCKNQIPYMEGYGGNFVVLMPNGLSAFRFADADNYDVEALATVSEQIRPWCQ